MSISGLGASALAGMRGFQPPSFSSLDTNKDGSITLDELEASAPGGASATSNAPAQKLFSAMDTNGDGSVTADEKSAFDQKVQSSHQGGGHHRGKAFLAQQLSAQSDTQAFAATDTNGDGSVSLDELSADPAAKDVSSSNLQQLFSLIDSNADGSISQSESSSFLDQVRQASGRAGGGPPPDGGPPGGVGGPGGFDPLSQLLASGSSDSADGDSDDSPDAAGTSSTGSSGASAAGDLLLLASNAYSNLSQPQDLLGMLQNLLQAA